MTDGKPRKSHFRKSFIAAVAGLGVGTLALGGGAVLHQPNTPPLQPQVQATQVPQLELARFVVAPRFTADQMAPYQAGLEGTTVQQRIDTLYGAIENDDTLKAAAILDFGIARSPDIVNYDIPALTDTVGSTAMDLAVLSGRYDIMKLLVLTYSVPVDYNNGLALIIAAQGNDAATVDTLLELGASASSADSMALRIAAAGNHDALARRLVQASANVNAGDGAPLLSAVSNDNLPLARFLLSHRAVVGANDNLALARAVVDNHPGMAALLVSHGADPQARDGRIMRYVDLKNMIDMKNALAQPHTIDHPAGPNGTGSRPAP